MQEIAERIRDRAVQLMNEGTVAARGLGWEKGEGECDWTPALFESVQEMDGFRVRRLLPGRT